MLHSFTCYCPFINAFDTVTRLSLPMIENIETVCAFTKNTGDAVKAAQALPVIWMGKCAKSAAAAKSSAPTVSP